jgi:hypothetical protein
LTGTPFITNQFEQKAKGRRGARQRESQFKGLSPEQQGAYKAMSGIGARKGHENLYNLARQNDPEMLHRLVDRRKAGHKDTSFEFRDVEPLNKAWTGAREGLRKHAAAGGDVDSGIGSVRKSLEGLPPQVLQMLEQELLPYKKHKAMYSPAQRSRRKINLLAKDETYKALPEDVRQRKFSKNVARLGEGDRDYFRKEAGRSGSGLVGGEGGLRLKSGGDEPIVSDEEIGTGGNDPMAAMAAKWAAKNKDRSAIVGRIRENKKRAGETAKTYPAPAGSGV